MGIKAFITDISTGLKAKISNANNTEENALIVATRPLKTFTNKALFFSNPIYGIDMNQDPGTAGTPVNIHNGIDNIYWTATAISGTWDFNSSAQAHTGIYSIDATKTKDSEVAQISKGSDQDLTGYTSLVGWIYITGWPTTGTNEVEIYGWDVGQVGNRVNIGDYVNTSIFNTWLKFVIPLIDMGLAENVIDAIRIETINIGIGLPPDYYLDDIQIQENEIPLKYIIEPEIDTWLYVDGLNTVMADALDATLVNASMYNLSYNTFLGLSELAIGILYQEYHGGKVHLTSTFHHILDFLQLPNTNILNAGCDGINTWFSLGQTFSSPVLLKSENEDKLVLNIRDDMSELLKFRMAVSCREEQR